MDGIVQKACTGLAARQPGMGPPSKWGWRSIPRTHARPTYRGKTVGPRNRPQGAIHNLAGNTCESHDGTWKVHNPVFPESWKVRQALPRGLHSGGRKVEQVQGGGCGYCLQHSYNSRSSKEGTSIRAASQLR